MIEKDILETSKKLMKKFEGINKQGFIKGIKQQTKGSAGLTFEKLKQNTRRYAKRQLTWFRKNPNLNFDI